MERRTAGMMARMIARMIAGLVVGTTLVVALLVVTSRAGGASGAEGRTAPEFPSLETSSWSGPPTSLASVRGKVVLLNVWTFGCYNCTRTLPWVRSVWERYRDQGMAVIGVHSPEFERERERSAVDEARGHHHLGYPSFIDNGHAYWRALDNHYWPTIYLLDKRGRIRAVQVGEVHEGDATATRLEAQIDSLLAGP